MKRQFKTALDKNIKGAVRYLVHTDNPEKYQYNREDIVCHGGAEVEQYFELSSVSRERTLWDIMKFIRDEKITSYSAFIGYCQDTDNREWFSIATKYYTLAIRTLIDSIYQDQKEPKNISDTIADNVRNVKNEL
ncbi:Rep family protein [Ligilactobacillus saerimneri]|uniref:Rep family protein n=1 Tax=Ligilactobacillus saerimneri TaxID=228229 RepID=UPI00294385BE|nr:Rep family protein [Ligilactobacillus saerimneri]